MTKRRILLGLIGANITRSLAPALFADAFAAAGIDGFYHLMDVDRLPGRRLLAFALGFGFGVEIWERRESARRRSTCFLRVLLPIDSRRLALRFVGRWSSCGGTGRARPLKCRMWRACHHMGRTIRSRRCV